MSAKLWERRREKQRILFRVVLSATSTIVTLCVVVVAVIYLFFFLVPSFTAHYSTLINQPSDAVGARRPMDQGARLELLENLERYQLGEYAGMR